MDNLVHRDLGGVGKPVLVVLHGLLGSSRNWLTTGGDLAADFHVLAPDLRNHGRSFHASEMNYQVMVEDVIRWMDTSALETIHLIGHSMGGKVAMALSCRYPDRVKKMVVVDIAPKTYRSNAHRAEFAAMNELHLSSLKSRAEAEMRMESRVPDLGMRKFLLTNLERINDGWGWSINLPVLTRALPDLEADSLSPENQYSGPSLFLNGGRSRYVKPEDRDVILAHFPKAALETIEQSGHNPHMEQREEFVQRVRAFALA